MRKSIQLFYFIIVAQFMAITGKSQAVKKGEIYLGSVLNISSDKHTEVITNPNVINDTETWLTLTKEITVIPQFGIGVGSHFMAGGGVGYRFSKSESSVYDVSIGTSVKINSTKKIPSVNVFASSFLEFNKSVGGFLWLDSRYSWGPGKQTYLNTQVAPPNEPLTVSNPHVSVFNASLRPGLYYKRKRFMLDARFGGLWYTNAINDDDYYIMNQMIFGKIRRSKFSFQLSGNVEIGCRFIVNAKRKTTQQKK